MVDSKTHVNSLDIVFGRLRSRPGVVYLKRLSIILDEDSEKGFGLVCNTTSSPDIRRSFASRSMPMFPCSTATTSSRSFRPHTRRFRKPASLTHSHLPSPVTLSPCHSPSLDCLIISSTRSSGQLSKMAQCSRSTMWGHWEARTIPCSWMRMLQKMGQVRRRTGGQRRGKWWGWQRERGYLWAVGLFRRRTLGRPAMLGICEHRKEFRGT